MPVFSLFSYGNLGASWCEKVSERICVNHTKTQQTQPVWKGLVGWGRHIRRQAGDISSFQLAGGSSNVFCIPSGDRGLDFGVLEPAGHLVQAAFGFFLENLKGAWGIVALLPCRQSGHLTSAGCWGNPSQRLLVVQADVQTFGPEGNWILETTLWTQEKSPRRTGLEFLCSHGWTGLQSEEDKPGQISTSIFSDGN